MKKIMKAGAAFLAVSLVSGALFARSGKTVTAEEVSIAEGVKEYVEKVLNGEEEDLYNDSFSVQVHLNSFDDYKEALHAVYDGVSEIQYRVIGTDGDTTLCSLYDGEGTYLTDLKMVKQADGSWTALTVFPQQDNYTLEVPAGTTVAVNGTTLSADYLVEKEAVSSGYKGMYTAADAPKVDRYRLNGLIDIPSVKSGETALTVMKDVTAPILYAGEDLTKDEEMTSMVIRYAETCAKFPAREGSLGAVAGIAVTNSAWYARVSGVQNDWFTAHNTSQFSNQAVPEIIMLGDDAAIANVVFDYYASNGTVSRTWNCGYQMFLVKQGGIWRIAGTGIDSTMNPRSDKIR